MRFTKVLLIAPRYMKGVFQLSSFPMTGLGYVAEALERAGVETRVLDMNLRYEFEDLAQMMESFAPELIGVSMMTFGHLEQYALMNRIRREYPEVRLMVGGSHVSTMREQVLAQCPAVDYGVVLEGDETVVQLCCGEPPASIAGLMYRHADEIVFNPRGSFIRDLDALGFPRYRSFELDKYSPDLGCSRPDERGAVSLRPIAIITSRGCPFDCIYCPVIAAIGKQFRYRSAQSVVEEIVYWHGLGYRNIVINDDNFTLLRERVEQICKTLIELKLGMRLQCPNGIRADRVDRELLALMKEAGFDWIAFGVEGGNDKVLATIKKGESMASIEKSIQDACDLGFFVFLTFILGSPGETMADIEDSFSLALRYPVAGVKFYNIVPFPNTELYDWIAARDYFLIPPEQILNDASHYVNEPCFETPELPAASRRRAFKLGREVERRIKRRFMERKLSLPGPLAAMVSYLATVPALERLLLTDVRVIRWKRYLRRLLFRAS